MAFHFYGLKTAFSSKPAASPLVDQIVIEANREGRQR